MIDVSAETLRTVCQRYHIQQLALFGSVLREDFNSESDIDVLVEFEPDHVPDFFRLYEIEQKLSALFGGRAVDLVTYRALNPYLRDAVLASAQVQYEQR